jgi:hypothetical protein
MSDAHVYNNKNYLLNEYRLPKRLCITNDYAKHDSVEAEFYNVEVRFIYLLQERLKQRDYFLYTSDQRREITKHFNWLMQYAPEHLKKKDFILITRESQFRLFNATQHFKNKLVFYSPTIVYGVDANFERPQDGNP